jgi:hypothetical protein
MIASSPLFICSIGDIAIFFDGRDSWLAKKGSYEADSQALRAGITLGWLPLLEVEYPAFRAHVLAELQVHFPQRSDVFTTFPIRELVLLALASASAYWTERALHWAAYLPPDAELQRHLKDVWADKTFPQRVRHQAKRLFFTGSAT